MNKICILSMLFFGYMQAAEGVVCRLAQEKDVPGVLEQFERATLFKDTDKIVILPKLFREKSLVATIEKQRLFVASEDEKIIGFKKCYLLIDPAELDSMLMHEIRSRYTSHVAGIVLRDDLTHVQEMPNHVVDDQGMIMLYNGGDFTDPDHRGKGVNTKLMQPALDKVKDATVLELLKPETKGLAMIFGLSGANAGEGILGGRTPSLLKAFNHFLETLNADSRLQCSGVRFSHEIFLTRHVSFMPTFNPESAECKPLPDEQSVPGFGCVLSCNLKMGE